MKFYHQHFFHRSIYIGWGYYFIVYPYEIVLGNDVEIITKVEYIHEYSRATTKVEPDYKWGEIYRMISNQDVPDVGFEELTIYANIEKSSLMKVSMRPELFPCSKVISWILPKADVTTMILANTAKQGYAAYSSGYVSLAYHLPPAQYT